jgi:DNA/RNA-binding domain of Phe-tRNA-synthetase-like protein
LNWHGIYVNSMTASRYLDVDPIWRQAHPGASVGLIAMRGVANPASNDTLNDLATALETDVRSRFGSADRETIRATPPLPAYAAYYKRWGQRYHVAMQLESVAQKGKALPRVAALVEAMFIAELRNLLLTAGHDLDGLALPVRLTTGSGDAFTAPNGQETTVKAGDMAIVDAQGRVVSAIVTGPSDVARIGPETTAALFYAYAPPGVDSGLVDAHLHEIERNVRLISPDAKVLAREIVKA